MKLLVGSIPELRAVVTFTGDLDFDTLRPALRSAQTLLARFVGDDLLSELEPGETALSDDQQELLGVVLVPICNLALLKFTQSGNVRITDLGVMRTQTAQSGDAFEWQLERIEKTLLEEAYAGIEELLRYLESRLTIFTSYAESDAYKASKDQLISSASLFSQYYDIGTSRLVFQTLQSAMRTAEIRTIRPLLGSALPDLLGATLSDQQQDQLDAARRALVYLTMARALREKLVSISDQGVQVSSISQTMSLRVKSPASEKQLAITMAYFDQEAGTFLSDLSQLLTPPAQPDTSAPPSRVIGSKIVSF